jgi:hypothetical protein
LSARKSNNTKRPKLGGRIVFLDRTHGKAMGAALRRVGFEVKTIWTVYRNKAHERTDDRTWIHRCAKEGWVAITGDKKIESDPFNRQAVIDAKAKIFMLSDSNSHPEEWSSAVIVGADRILGYFDKEGPFFVSVGKQAHGHVGRFRVPTANRGSDEQTEAAQPQTAQV